MKLIDCSKTDIQKLITNQIATYTPDATALNVTEGSPKMQYLGSDWKDD